MWLCPDCGKAYDEAIEARRQKQSEYLKKRVAQGHINKPKKPPEWQPKHSTGVWIVRFILAAVALSLLIGLGIGIMIAFDFM